MDFETLLYEVKDGVLTLTLNRPDKLNAFTGQMAKELVEAFDAADADDEVRVVVMTGAGRGFCAGADLSTGAATFDYDNRSDRAGASDGVPARDTGGRVTLRMFASLKPIIGAINGPAVGIGATMQMPMDIRLASDKARFGFVFAKRGIVPEAASSWFLPRLVGMQQAQEWMLTGRVFDAAEALAGGLVKEVVPHDDLLPRAYELAHEIADHTAPVSVAMIRQMQWQMLTADHPMEAHKIDSRGVYDRGQSADAKEGVMSFLEKREATYPCKVSTDMPAFFPWWEEREYE